MRTLKKNKEFIVDNSGSVHFGSHRKGRSNTFRLSVTLNTVIDPVKLQEAFDVVSPRFPMLVAGFRHSYSQYIVTAVDNTPQIIKDEEFIAFMPLKEIKKCAMRVLYSQYTISVEFFHSLTDGYGGFEFLKSLLCEYLKRAEGVECYDEKFILAADDIFDEERASEEAEDCFVTYAGKEKVPFNNVVSYLPGTNMPDSRLHKITSVFLVKDVIDAAHRFDVSLTTFLTAVMMKSIMQLQLNECRNKSLLKPVQIMVPIDLRRVYNTRTLRNFSLYAIPCINHEDISMPFEKFVKHIDTQLKSHFLKKHLEGMMANNVSLQVNPFMKVVPLLLKYFVTKIGFNIIGSKNTSLTLTNMGELRFPEKMLPYIEHIGVHVSARARSPYNCAMGSFGGRLYFNISRGSTKAELEPVFFANLKEFGCVPEIFFDDKRIDVNEL